MSESHTPHPAVSRSRDMGLLRDAPPNAKVGLFFGKIRRTLEDPEELW